MAESNTAALSIQPSHCQSLCLDLSNCQHLNGQSAIEEFFSETEWNRFIDMDDFESDSLDNTMTSQDISMVDTLNLEADLEMNSEKSKQNLIEGNTPATPDQNDKNTIVSRDTENETSHASKPMAMLLESSMIAGKVAVAQAQVNIIVLSSDDELQPMYDRSLSSRRRKTVTRNGFPSWKEANKLLRRQYHSTPAKLCKVKASSRSSDLVTLEEYSRSAGLALEVEHWHTPWLSKCYESLKSVIKTFGDLERSKTMGSENHGLMQTLFSKILIIRGHIQEGKASNYTSECNQGSGLQFFNNSIMAEALRQCSERLASGDKNAEYGSAMELLPNHLMEIVKEFACLATVLIFGLSDNKAK